MRITCFLIILVVCITTTIQSITEQFPYPIDIVYLWVDGSDPIWLSIKNHELVLWQTKADGVTANRFNNNDELRYSLRSVLQYAPFFNHIYIITMNQCPQWLKTHPKISIIDHKEIFRKPDTDLPTFNSHALESNLHRIPGLSEHFIYFNDDVFLGQPVSPFDFFTLEGKIKVLFEAALSPSGQPLSTETVYRRAWRNTNAYLDANFVKEERFRLCHAPFALRKSLMETTEQEVPFVFDGNSSHKFRCDKDFNIVNGFLQYYWKYKGFMEVGSLSNMMVSLRGDAVYERTAFRMRKLGRLKPHVFCLQDVMPEESSKTKNLLESFLRTKYPEPAPWEKPAN